MARTPFDQLSCCHGAQDCTGGRNDWQPWQDGYMHSSMLPIYASSKSQVDNAPYSAAILTGVQNNFTIAAAAFDNGFSRTDGHVNEFHHFSASQSVMLPWTDPGGIPCDRFGEWNWTSSTPFFPGFQANPPSMLNPPGYSALNQPALTEFGGFEDLSYVNMQNTEPSDPTSDQLLPALSVSCPLSSNNGDEPAVDNYFVDISMLDFSYDFQNGWLPSALTTEHQPPSIPHFQTSASSDFGDPSFQKQGYWNCAPQGGTIYDPSQASTSNLSPDTTYNTSHNSFASRRDSYPLGAAGKNRGLPAKAIKVKKTCRIIAMPTVSPQRLIKGTESTNALCSRLKAGRRHGPLPSETRKGAALMRQIGACARCAVYHVQCSEDEICDRCRKQPSSPFQGRLCHRDHLESYFKYLLPRFLDAHLERGIIESFTSTLKFVGPEIMVDVSTGSSHPPIFLLVSEYLPPNKEFLDIADLTPESNDHMPTFATVSSLQYGLREYRIDELRGGFLKHIETISNWEHILGDNESLSWKLLRAICRFQEADPSSKQNSLLRKAIMVNRIHYAIDHLITFSEESASKALGNLQNPPATPPSVSFLSARAINRQIKAVFHILQEDLQMEVLKQFDKELKQKNKDDWALCLSTLLVLCMCAEEVQVAIDGFVLKTISSEDGDPKKPSVILQDSMETCCNLERYVLDHSWILVHGKLSGVLRKPNIFKHGCPIGDESGYSESVVNLVNDIRQIMADHKEDILEAAGDQYPGGLSETVGEHKEFCEYNAGRLASKVLNELLK